MKILLVNHYAGGPDLGMEHRPWLLAREWISLGHEVLIVAAGFAHTRTHQPEEINPRSIYTLSGVPYLFIPTPSYQGNHIRRVVNMLAFTGRLWLQAKRIARQYNPDFVIASSTYPLDIWPCHRIARACGARLVYEVHDLWPLSPVELGGFSRRHPYIQLLQKAENFACRHSDKVVSLLPLTLEHLQEHGMQKDNFLYIPNGVVTQDWNTTCEVPAEHKTCLDRAHHEGRLVVGYTGAHGIANALDPLLDAAKLVQELPVSFLLVGNGPEKERLMQRSRESGLNHVFFAASVSKHQLPALLQQMDFLYVGFQKQTLYRFGVSPNKMFDYMMAGKPIIQAIKAGNNPVEEAGCGLAVEPDNPEAIAAAIRSLLAMSPEERERLGKKGRVHVMEHHDYKILALKFIGGISRAT